MELNLARVQQNVANSTTEDLLDRATIYRHEMEPEALELIDAELLARGVTVETLASHLDERQQALTRPDGTVIKCSFCYRPAVRLGTSWHLMFGWVPIFQHQTAWCDVHLPNRMRG